ncbi:MAG: SpoIIE family protein phosphatase [Pseudanabaenaceae cyanobacterium bins.39]|nr:SpoIIE family protein phosphatase [Pseudanabaenaceae cyanobacterium bins.39]
MNFLITEIDSRIEFTQKEIYGTIYLRPINQLWQYIPKRQLLVQQKFYRNFQNIETESLSQEIKAIDLGIANEFKKLNEIDNRLGKKLKTDNILKNLQSRWQTVVSTQEFLNFRGNDLLNEEINSFQRHIGDYSNLILDPDLDSYYLMDAICFKLPEMQKLLYKLIRKQEEIKFNQAISSEDKSMMISLVSLLGDYNTDLGANLDRAFQNNPLGNLRKELSVFVRNFLVSISEINNSKSQFITQENLQILQDEYYNSDVQLAFENSFQLWNRVADSLDILLNHRIQSFKERKQFVLTFVAVVMVAIAYLFIGFYLSVMRTVHQLDIAAKQMTSGGTMTISLDSRDELSMVVRSFNSIAQALKESEQKYRGIFENAVDGIFQTTVNGQYLSINPALAKIYGYESVEDMLNNVTDIEQDLYVDRDRRRQFQEAMDRQDTITNFESEVYKKDHSTIWISENVRAFRDENGKILFYEGTVEDITQRKLAEMALEGANQQILELNNLLKEENLRMSGELEVTRKLQQMILPKEHELARISGLDIAGFMEPAAEVGGDYYDVLQQDGKVKIGIGDVTGHGLESGMLMIMVQTAVRTLLQNGENDPVKFLDTLNRTIYGNVQRMNSSKNLTLSLLDYEHGRLTLSGQHEEMILVRHSGQLERIDTIDLGFPIGLEEEIIDFLAQTHIDLESGDVVVLYTDGITEAENEAKELYGVERLCEVICEHVHSSARDIRQKVIEDLRSHIGTQKIFDDITLLVIKRK